MSQSQLIGTWKIVSAQYRRANGETLEIYSAQPAGMLMYDADRYMSVLTLRRRIA